MRRHAYHPLAWVTVYIVMICHHRTARADILYTSNPSCAVAYPPPSTPLPACDNSSATLEEAIGRASDVAPIIVFHPLEEYFLQSPDAWYNQSELYLTDNRPLGNSSYDFIYNFPSSFVYMTPKTYRSVIKSSKLSSDQKNALLAGDSFDPATNQSTAKVAFTVIDYNSSYFLYTFDYYYSWRGCSQQDIAFYTDGKLNVTKYQLCPSGSYEGDWQHISALVCKSDWQVKRFAYSQQDWVEVRDCTVAGKCLVDNSTGKYVAYAGLQSHNNYYQPNPFYVYDFTTGNSTSASGNNTIYISNLGGLYVGDRVVQTNSPAQRRWIPRPELLLYMQPDPNSNQTTTTPTTTANVTTSNATLAKPTTEWMYFAGNWGGPTPAEPVNITCFNDLQTQMFPCGNNTSVTNLILEATKLAVNLIPGSSPSSIDQYTSELNSGAVIPYPLRPGPLAEAWTYTWLQTPIPYIQGTDNGTTLTCPNDAQAGSQAVYVDPASFDVGISSVTTYLVGIALGDFIFSILLAIVMCLPVILDKSSRVQRVIVRQAHVFGRRAVDVAKKAGKATENAVESIVDPSYHSNANNTNNSMDGSVDKGEEGGEKVSPVVAGAAVVVPAAENEDHAEKGIKAVTTTAPTTITNGEGGGVGVLEENTQDSEGLDPGPTATSSLPSRLSSSKTFIVGEDLQNPGVHDYARYFIWFFVGTSLFIAGLILSIYGTFTIFSDSVVSAALKVVGASSVSNIVEILIVAILAVVGFFDVVIIFLLFFMRPSTFQLYKWRVKNVLGGWKWAIAHSYELYVVSVGILILNISLAVLLFGLGLLVTIFQIMVRVVCSSVLNVSVDGTSIIDVCINIPFLFSQPVCGWQAWEVCAGVTNMQVLLLLLGSMLLTWCHIVFLIAMVVALERHKKTEVVVKKGSVGDFRPAEQEQSGDVATPDQGVEG